METLKDLHKEEEKNEEFEMRKLTKISHKWAFWENWKRVKPSRGEMEEKQYLDNMQAVAAFDNLIDFLKIWQNLHYGTPSLFFLCPEKSQQNQYKYIENV